MTADPLRLPDRHPGQVVGSIAVTAGLTTLHRALVPHARAMRPADVGRLAAVLNDLEAVLGNEHAGHRDGSDTGAQPPTVEGPTA